MEKTARISPFQVIMLLFAGRLFSTLIWSPTQTQVGSSLLATVILPVVGTIIAVVCRKFFEGFWRGNVPSFLYKSVLVFIWAVLLFYAATTIQSCSRLLSLAFYGKGYYPLLVITFVVASVLCAHWGLQSIARATPVITLASVVLLVLLWIGVMSEYHLSYMPPLLVSGSGTLNVLIQNVSALCELLLFTLLTQNCTKPPKGSACAWWLSANSILSIVITLTVIFSLGQYANNLEYPAFAVSRLSSIMMGERLEPVFMGVWVLLGLIRTSLFTCTGDIMLTRFSPNFKNVWRYWLQGIVLLVLVLVVGQLNKEFLLALQMACMLILLIIVPIVIFFVSKVVKRNVS